MSRWMDVSIGLLAGVVVVAGAIFFAIRPYVQARPPKPLMPHPSDNKDDMKAWAGWQSLVSNDPPSSGGDGAV